MSRIIEARDGRRYRRLSRWIKLYPYVCRDDYFFDFSGRRYRLSLCERLIYPIFFEDDDGKDAFLSGYYTFCNTCCLLIEMDYNGAGYVRLYELIEGDDD